MFSGCTGHVVSLSSTITFIPADAYNIFPDDKYVQLDPGSTAVPECDQWLYHSTQ